MRLLRKLAAVATAAVLVTAGGTLVPQADDTPSVYNTPGGQVSGERLWNTTCEMYSSNVVRCRAEIWATQVSYVNGRYVQKTGWTFNNLSYLPSPRASWEGNNLGQSNDSWTSGGKTWKTECGTATTGQGGCPCLCVDQEGHCSEIWVRIRVQEQRAMGLHEQWVFNNLVLFSTDSVPAVNEVPAHILDQSRLGLTGMGPLQLGASMKDLKTLGYLKYPGDECDGYGETTLLKQRGIRAPGGTTINSLLVTGEGVKTVDDAHVGMTYAEVKEIYGDRISKLTMNDPAGEDVPTAVVRSGPTELVFTAVDLGPLEDASEIDAIVARPIHQGYPYAYEYC